MQSDLTVDSDDYSITGTLKYLSSGQLPDYWGAGNFMALKFTVPADATSVKVGLDPSQGSGLVEIIDDPDKNGAFKVTNKDTQKFKIVTTTAEGTVTKLYDLSDLVCLEQTTEEVTEPEVTEPEVNG